MRRVAKFETVSKEVFTDACSALLPGRQADYRDIRLPARATVGSAGYDFYAPADIVLRPSESAVIPTGVRVWIEQGWALKLYPRSGLGFKYRLQLDNTVGIIDSDYFYSDNQGHILIKLTNDNRQNKPVTIKKGEAFAQGVFSEYGITLDDCAEHIRNGGFGSTDGQGS